MGYALLHPSYELHWQGDGPPLVAIPGWAMTAAVMKPWLDSLTPHWRVTVVDLPGHGVAPDGIVEPQRLAREIGANLDAPALWVGWSLGAQVALAAARERDWVSAMLLIGATPCFTQASDWPAARPRQEVRLMRRRLALKPDRVVRDFMALLAAHGVGSRRAVARIGQHTGGRPRGLASGLDCLLERDWRSSLPTMPQPTTWLVGDSDPLVPVAAAQYAAAAMPTARAHVIGGAGHLPFLTHADAVNAALAAIRTENT